MKKQTVVIGITSGIAACKMFELVQMLKNNNLNIHVVMTENATKIVPAKKFEQVSKNPVYVKLFQKDFDYAKILKNRKVEHIELADKADIVVIAPATANTIAKLSYGIANDFLTTMVLATKVPVLVFPSMNVHMWENITNQHNIKVLQNRGFLVFGPSEGNLACGYRGKGRLPDIGFIEQEIVHVLNDRTKLRGKRILITSGATQEPIDDVRFITNKSSGKMGNAIANECFFQEADVLLLRSESSVEPQFNIAQKTFVTSSDLHKLIKEKSKDYDILFHTAAVSDFTVQNKFKGKISSRRKINIELIPAKKIITLIKKTNPKIFLIGFKAVYGLQKRDVKRIGLEKIKESNADAIVVNDISKNDRGFGADTNEVYIVFKNGEIKHIPLTSKELVARELISLTVTSLP